MSITSKAIVKILSMMPMMRAATFAIRNQTSGPRGMCIKEKTKNILPPNPCDAGDEAEIAKAKEENKKATMQKFPKSMWKDPVCCTPVCDEYQERYDDTLYKASDKRTRKYIRTWSECPALKIVPMRLCYTENIKYPQMEKRKRKPRSKEQCSMPVKDHKRLMLCRAVDESVCPRVMMPGCAGAMFPPKCHRQRRTIKCTKKCAPFPSFSECKRWRPARMRQCECVCLDIPSSCETWHHLRKIQRIARERLRRT